MFTAARYATWHSILVGMSANHTPHSAQDGPYCDFLLVCPFWQHFECIAVFFRAKKDMSMLEEQVATFPLGGGAGI